VPLTYKVRVKQLDAVKLKDIREHYLKTHFTRNCRFIIAGRIAPYRKAIINRLENLQIHKGRRRLDLPSETPRSLGKPLVMFHKGIDNLYYRWESAMPVVLDETERESLRCLQDLLFNTFHSRIFGIARERGLLYGLSANFYRTRDHHVWYVQGQVLPQNIRPLFDLILKQISEVCAAKISCQEVEAVKLFALGTLQRGIQTVDQLAGWYSQDFEFDDYIRDFAATNRLIKTLTKADIVHAARTLFRHSDWGLAFLGLTPGVDMAALNNTIGNLYN
jgi:hypothetical protein